MMFIGTEWVVFEADAYCANPVIYPDQRFADTKKAMEEGYKDIKNVYKDNEFSSLRKDPRFAELMAVKTTAISD